MSEEAEKSFFKHCELETLKVDKYTFEHDLTRWGLTIQNARIKGDKIHIDIVAPYQQMLIEMKEVNNDSDFFGKNTVRLYISNKMGESDFTGYFTGRTITFPISVNTTHILFSTPYFIPHNHYTLNNIMYLYKKILFSGNFLQYFLARYRESFTNGVPFIHIKQTRENKDMYEMDIIVKDYLNIYYITTDVDTSTILLTILIDMNKKASSKNQSPNKYHCITLKIPRIVRNGNVFFKFKINTH